MKSGIYQIICVVNNKSYVGSSFNIKKRLSTHINQLKKNNHHSCLLQRSWNKYGEQSFFYNILENSIDLLNRENFFLKKLNPEFNISKDALSPMKGRKHTRKTKDIMSNVHRNNKYNLGRKQSEFEKRQRSISRKNFKWSDDVKFKMSQSSKRMNRFKYLEPFINNLKKEIIDSNGIHHKSLTEASRYYDISVQAICDNLKGRSNKTRKGVTFKYV